MELRDLKQALLNNNTIRFPIVFLSENNDYLITSYINQIIKNTSRELKKIMDFNEIRDIEESVFFEDNLLLVYYADNKLINPGFFSDIKSPLIIISDKKIDNIPENIEVVLFKKLENWQIEDYIATLLPGLSEREIIWLCQIAKYDIYRLVNEASKINIFDKKYQSTIFKQINDDNGYCDLNDLTIYDLTNAIVRKDLTTIASILKDIDSIDIEGVGVITLLARQYLNLINVSDHKNTAASLGMNPKQYNAIKYNCSRYKEDDLIKVYKFLCDLDSRLKNGLLDMSNNDLIYYIINNVI